MSGRKHLIQQVLFGKVEPPTEGQAIVRAVGSRGGNVMEVRFTAGVFFIFFIESSLCSCWLYVNIEKNYSVVESYYDDYCMRI